MANYSVPTGKVALSSAATKSLFLINPVANCKLRLLDISMDGSAAVTAVQLELYRVNSLGSPAGTSVTPLALYEGDPAASATALTALSAEPTSIFRIATWELQPLGGLMPLSFPFGFEVIGKAGGARIGLRAITPSGVTPNIDVNAWIEE